MSGTILSILMLAAIALGVGAIVLLRRGERKRGWLMAGAALVAAQNVANWLVPLPG